MRIKISAECIVEVDASDYPPGTSPETIAEQTMDHAPDLLYDSPETVYRYEVLGAQTAPASEDDDARALLTHIEALLAQLRARL